MTLHCRFYEALFPAVEDIVVVQVRQVTDIGSFVELVEYDGSEGLILYQELCNRRIRSVHKLVRPGQLLCCSVIRVDADKGYIDLSRRRVTPEQRDECREKFAQKKCVNNILCRAGQLLKFNDSQLQDLYSKTAWHFDRAALTSDLEGEPGSLGAYQAFRQIAATPETLDQCEGLTEDERRVVLDCVQTRLGLTEVKIQCTVAVTCFTSEGIDAIKNALRAGRALSTDEVPLRVQVVSSPVYSLSTTTLHQSEGMRITTEALDRIKQTIEAAGGSFKVESPPRMVFHWGSFREEMTLFEGQATLFEGQGQDVEVPLGVPDDLTVWSAQKDSSMYNFQE